MANFFAVLKRRYIYQVSAAYIVVAWLLLQLFNNLDPILKLPEWAGTLVLVFLIGGFPIALIFAWALELKSTSENTNAATGKENRANALVTSPSEATLPRVTEAAGKLGVISIAVLPFANMSGDPAREFFSDGMTEEITSALAKVPNLRVVARTSAFQFKRESRDIQSIGQALHASHLIEGSVRMDGNQVRITAQLIKADDGTHMWTESYNRKLRAVFAVQEEIAQAIAAALQMPLGLKQGQTLISNRTNDLDAYQEYLRARALFRARSINDTIATLESVVARDPKFVPAWGLLANAYLLLPLYSSSLRCDPLGEARGRVKTNLEKGEKAAREALRLDERSATGYAGLAFFEHARSKWIEAEDLYKKALEPDPNEPDTLHFYSIMLVETGHVGRALAIREKLRALEPFVPIYNAIYAGTMQMSGKHDDAIAILEPDASRGFFRNVYLATAYAARGLFDKVPDTLLLIQGNLVTRRSVEDAARLIRTPMRSLAPEQLPILEGELSFVYAHIGAADRILDFPERQLAIGYAFGSLFGLWFPSAALARKTERFKKLVRKAGLVDYWRARGWPDLCRPMGAQDFICD